jgi:hypothetical protein
VAGRDGQRVEVLLAEGDQLALLGLVALDDVGVLDLLPVERAGPLVLDPATVGRVHLVERMSWFVVAAYALTGTLTSPNDTAPLHIARIRLDLPISLFTKSAVQCQHDGVQPMLATPGDLRSVRSGSTRSSGTGCGCSPEVADGGLQPGHRRRARTSPPASPSWPA